MALLQVLQLTACSSPPASLAESLAALPSDAGPKGAVHELSPELQQKLTAIRGKIRAGKRQAALSWLRKLIAEQPGLVEARALLADAWIAELESAKASKMQSEDWVDAVLETETAVRSALIYRPRDAGLMSRLGRIYEIDGHREAALDAYRKALSYKASDVPALLAAARLATALGEERSATRQLEALRVHVKHLPSDVLLWETRCYLTLVHSLQSEPSIPSGQLEEQRRKNDRNRRTYLARARRAFEELASRLPKDARGSSGSAYCRYLQLMAGDIEKSPAQIQKITELYRHAAQLAPSDALPRFDLAVFLESKLVDDPIAAIQAYRGALERKPGHLDSQINLARLLWLAKPGSASQRAAAKALWRQALPRLEGREKARVEELLRSGS